MAKTDAFSSIHRSLGFGCSLWLTAVATVIATDSNVELLFGFPDFGVGYFLIRFPTIQHAPSNESQHHSAKSARARNSSFDLSCDVLRFGARLGTAIRAPSSMQSDRHNLQPFIMLCAFMMV
jgi:hypothetical protein